MRLLSLAVLLFVWWFVAERGIWSEVFVPRPSSVWGRFVESVTTDERGRPGLSDHYLWEHLWASLWRIIQGVGWAILFGVALGLLLASVKPLRVVAEPSVNVIRRHLELVGLGGFGGSAPYELSGGMQQRCQIAPDERTRALRSEPAFVAFRDRVAAAIREDVAVANR